jgi:hypothetical protein
VAGIPLVDLSEPLSRGIGDNPRLIGAPACENGPGNRASLLASAIASRLRWSRFDPCAAAAKLATTDLMAQFAAERAKVAAAFLSPTRFVATAATAK